MAWKIEGHIVRILHRGRTRHGVFNIRGLVDSIRLVDQTVFFKSRQLRRQAGSAKGLITIAADFDEPLDDFAEYMS